MTGSLTSSLQYVPLPVNSADHVDRILCQQSERYLAVGHDSEREHPGIYFRAFPFFVAHPPL